MRAHCAPHATGLPLLPVVCLLVTMGMDMNEWLIAWIVLLKAVRAVCAPKCLEKDARADFLCLHCYPNAVGDNAGAYLVSPLLKTQTTEVSKHVCLSIDLGDSDLHV